MSQGYKGMAQIMERDIPFLLSLFVYADTPQLTGKGGAEILSAHYLPLTGPALDYKISRFPMVGIHPDHFQYRFHVRRERHGGTVLYSGPALDFGGFEPVGVDKIVLDGDNAVLYVPLLEPPNFSPAHTAPGRQENRKPGKGIGNRQGYQLP
jgi:hypothetical protein